jgi:hypothetical protein
VRSDHCDGSFTDSGIIGVGEHLIDIGAKLSGRSRVELTGHGGWAY